MIQLMGGPLVVWLVPGRARELPTRRPEEPLQLASGYG
jgi:hypothetical protein